MDLINNLFNTMKKCKNGCEYCSKPMEQWSDKGLKSEYYAIKESVEKLGCFSGGDIAYLERLEHEMENRN